MEIPVLDTSGASAGSLTIDPETLGGEINPALIKQAYVMYHANLRQGSARTKSRGMVEGSTRKLYRQKGTGNARAGSARTNIRRGGGRAFAKTKTREDYRLDMPVKMRRKANRNALLAKLFGGVVDGKKVDEVIVLKDLSMPEPKTSALRQILSALGVDRSCLLALDDENVNARLSARNLDDVTVINARQLTAFELMNHRYLVITQASLEAWLEASAGTSKGGKNRESARQARLAAAIEGGA